MPTTALLSGLMKSDPADSFPWWPNWLQIEDDAVPSGYMYGRACRRSSVGRWLIGRLILHDGAKLTRSFAFNCPECCWV